MNHISWEKGGLDVLQSHSRHGAVHVSANTQSHQLHWGDREVGTAISCKKGCQMAGLIHMVASSISNIVSVCAAVLPICEIE